VTGKVGREEKETRGGGGRSGPSAGLLFFYKNNPVALLHVFTDGGRIRLYCGGANPDLQPIQQ
jgi:hypothetical protein